MICLKFTFVICQIQASSLSAILKNDDLFQKRINKNYG